METHGSAQHNGFGQTESGHGHHKGKGGAEWDTFVKENHGNGHNGGTTSVHGNAEGGGNGYGEDAGGLHKVVDGILRDVVVDEGTNAYAYDDPEPDLPNDGNGFVESVTQSCGQCMLHNRFFIINCVGYVFFQMAMEFHFSEQGTGHCADEETVANVCNSHGQSEFFDHQDYKVFVDDGRGEEK